VLAELGDAAKVLAGGQSLLALMNLRVARPEVLVDLGGCGLSGIARDGCLEIGAMTTHTAASKSEAVRESAPLLEHALGYVGHHAIRNRGTIGGSVAHADPAAEVPAVLLALGGEVSVLGPGGGRTIDADELFVSFYTTALAEDEVLTAIRLPESAPDAWAFGELARRHGDFAIVGVAASFDLTPSGEVADARVAVFGAADRPVRVSEAEAVLHGRRLDDAAAVGDAAVAAREAVDPIGDIHGSKSYRKRVTEVVVRRALENATIEERAAA
jgi:carbon-monoxide dehydrogenase medium subunit